MSGEISITARYPAVNVATGAILTLIQVVAPSASRIVVKQISVTFNSDSNTDEPYQVQLLRQSGAGTSSAGSVYKINTDDSAAQQTTSRIAFTAEPTAQDILQNWYVHPQANLIWEPPFDLPLVVAASGRIGIRILTPIVQANSSTGYIIIGE